MLYTGLEAAGQGYAAAQDELGRIHADGLGTPQDDAAAVRWYFLAYLILWPALVCGGLIVACGLAAGTVFPVVSNTIWGVIHAVGCFLIVLGGSYITFERIIKIIIAVMFLAIIGAACGAGVAWPDVAVPQIIPTPTCAWFSALSAGSAEA